MAIAYTMQRRGIRDFGIDRTAWNRLLKGIYDEERALTEEIEKGLEEERAETVDELPFSAQHPLLKKYCFQHSCVIRHQIRVRRSQ